MMGKRYNWVKFYPDDWNGDIELTSCSLAAQGLLVRLMAVMHRAKPYGYLLQNGRKPAPKLVSQVLGVDQKEYEKCLKELLKNGVLKQDKTGIFSARMVRDQQEREEMRRRGAKGGNPGLVNQEDNQEVNQGSKRLVKPDSDTDIDKEAEAEEKLTHDDFPVIPDPVKTRLRSWQHGSNAVWVEMAKWATFPEEWLLAAIDSCEKANACNARYLKGTLEGIKREGGPGRREEKKAPPWYEGMLWKSAGCDRCDGPGTVVDVDGEWLCKSCFEGVKV